MTRQSPPGGTPNRPPKAPARLVKDAALLDKLTRPADHEPLGSPDPDYDGGAASRSEQNAAADDGCGDPTCPHCPADPAAEAAQSPQEGPVSAEKSAEAPRTPGQIARVYSDGCMHEWSRTDGACVGCVAAAVRAALAARDAEWRQAFTRSGLVEVLEDDPEPDNEDTNPLRALLSEGKPGK
jgi:hypothetical protein